MTAETIQHRHYAVTECDEYNVSKQHTDVTLGAIISELEEINKLQGSWRIPEIGIRIKELKEIKEQL